MFCGNLLNRFSMFGNSFCKIYQVKIIYIKCQKVKKVLKTQKRPHCHFYKSPKISNDDQPKLRGSRVVVTLVCEYTRDLEGIWGVFQPKMVISRGAVKHWCTVWPQSSSSPTVQIFKISTWDFWKIWSCLKMVFLRFLNTSNAYIPHSYDQ